MDTKAKLGEVIKSEIDSFVSLVSMVVNVFVEQE
jgi:hypothetical protein